MEEIASVTPSYGGISYDRLEGEGLLFMAFHFLESNANILTNPAMDPIAKIPEFKVCAVRLEKAA